MKVICWWQGGEPDLEHFLLARADKDLPPVTTFFRLRTHSWSGHFYIQMATLRASVSVRPISHPARNKVNVINEWRMTILLLLNWRLHCNVNSHSVRIFHIYLLIPFNPSFIPTYNKLGLKYRKSSCNILFAHLWFAWTRKALLCLMDCIVS